MRTVERVMDGMFQLPVSGLHLVAYDRKHHMRDFIKREDGRGSSSNGKKYLG